MIPIRTNSTTANLRAGVLGATLVSLGALSWPGPALVSTGPTVIPSLPFTITEPGAYCLTQNLQAPPFAEGIEVQASNVVIDLCGFSLIGPGEDSGTTAIFGNTSNVVVRNGAITYWGRDGVRTGSTARVEDLMVSLCGENAIDLRAGAEVTRCLVWRCTGTAIKLAENSRMTECQVSSKPGGWSINVGPGSQLDGVLVSGGSVGIVAGEDSSLVNCKVRSVDGVSLALEDQAHVVGCQIQTDLEGAEVGIRAGENSTIVDCQVGGSLDTGIQVGSRSRLKECQVFDTTGQGIETGEGCLVQDCMISRANQGGTPGWGLEARPNSVVRGTSVTECIGGGIRISGPGGVIEDCSVYANAGDGIETQGYVVGRNNFAVDNLGTGFEVNGFHGVLSDNFAVQNDLGLELTGHSVLVIGNRAEGNFSEDYELRWGNPFGPISNSIGQIGGSVPQANF